jgi:hypothetical protein
MAGTFSNAPAWGPVTPNPGYKTTPPAATRAAAPARVAMPSANYGLLGKLNPGLAQRLQGANARGAPPPGMGTPAPVRPAAPPPSTPNNTMGASGSPDAGGGNPRGGDTMPPPNPTPAGVGFSGVDAGWGAGANSSSGYAKGGNVKSCSYAEGGPVMGRSRSFLKSDNEFTTGKGVPQAYRKSGKHDSDPAAATKSDAPAMKSLRK